MTIAFSSRPAAALREKCLANRRRFGPSLPTRMAAPLPRSVPDADRGVIYEFAIDTVGKVLMDLVRAPEPTFATRHTATRKAGRLGPEGGNSHGRTSKEGRLHPLEGEKPPKVSPRS